MATHARVGDPSRGEGGAKEPCQGTAVDRRRRAAVVMATLREWVGGRLQNGANHFVSLTRSGVRTVCETPGAGRAWPLAIIPGVMSGGVGVRSRWEAEQRRDVTPRGLPAVAPRCCAFVVGWEWVCDVGGGFGVEVG